MRLCFKIPRSNPTTEGICKPYCQQVGETFCQGRHPGRNPYGPRNKFHLSPTPRNLRTPMHKTNSDDSLLPQTDGLVERFNHTLKSMLRKTFTTEGKNWDDLPYFLFAYREVPQVLNGFSSFELLYGTQVRPLDILRDSWVASPKTSESIISYVLLMQERLSELLDLVKQNLQHAQDS